MTTLGLNQTLAGSFTSSSPKLNGSYYNDYDLPLDLTNFEDISIVLDPINNQPSTGANNTPGYTYVDLINATTGTVISESVATTYTKALIDQTVAPGVQYKLRLYNTSLSNGNYSLSLTDAGAATSLVSNGYVGANGTDGPQVGTLNANGKYFTLAKSGSLADVALSSSGLLYGIEPSAGNYQADLLSVIDPSLGRNSPYSYNALKDTSGNKLAQSLKSLAFDGNNQLYAVGTSDTGVGGFYQININTNVATLLATLPLGFNGSGDLVYDAANNRFLASSADLGTSDALWQIPLSNPTGATKLSDIGFVNVVGLAFENGKLIGYSANTNNGSSSKITIDSNKFTSDPTNVSGTLTQALTTAVTGPFLGITGAATIVPITTPTRNDFNGDKKSDILWRSDSGGVAMWQMDGSSVTNTSLASIPNLDPTWKSAGTGDFNGDGKSDILWRNDNGGVAVWTMNGSTVVSSSLTSTPTLATSWKAAGTGDFNGDGKSDILWRNDNGGVAVWTMDGSTVVSSSLTSTPTLATSWKVAGTGDFNGDGKSDILWRNDDGSVALWQMNGNNVVSSSLTSTPSLDGSWKINGTADFNGDGKADILWRNENTGAVDIWQMNGATVLSSSLTSTPSLDSSWKITGTGDFNGDAKADILWRKDSGAVAVWQMNGAAVVSSNLTSIQPLDPAWKIAAPIL